MRAHDHMFKTAVPKKDKNIETKKRDWGLPYQVCLKGRWWKKAWKDGCAWCDFMCQLGFPFFPFLVGWSVFVSSRCFCFDHGKDDISMLSLCQGQGPWWEKGEEMSKISPPPSSFHPHPHFTIPTSSPSSFPPRPIPLRFPHAMRLLTWFRCLWKSFCHQTVIFCAWKPRFTKIHLREHFFHFFFIFPLYGFVSLVSSCWVKNVFFCLFTKLVF